MKKILSLFLLMIGAGTLTAQDITDALRYSQEELSGTARFTAMSGAFGALGGDISSFKINPAGSAVFLRSKGTFTLNLRKNQNTNSFLDGRSTFSDSKIDLTQGGLVFTFNNYAQNSAFRKFTFGIAYDQTANHRNNIFVHGNNNESIGDYFLNRAQGVPLDLFVPLTGENLTDLYLYLGSAPVPSGYSYGSYGMQTAYLGYETFLFDANDPNDFSNTIYTSNIAGNEFYQEYNQVSTGLNGRVTINAGGQIGDNLYIGANLNSHFINYDRTTGLYEENNDANSSINRVYFENTLHTKGTGLSLQVGAIYKLNQMFRIGASYTSPTWYTISEETSQYLESDSNQDGLASADPRVLNIFPDYKLKTPGKLTGSIAMIFGQSGLISFDYSYKDYGNTTYSTKLDGPVFYLQNKTIKNSLKATSSYRVGGEYRVYAWSLRAGYRFEESPYQDKTRMDDLTGYSLGFGYDFGGMSLDFAYSHAQQDYAQTLYQTDFSSSAWIENKISNYTLSLTFNL